MQNVHSPVVDQPQPETPLSFFPDAPLLSSDRAGWSSIQLQYHHQPAGEPPELCHSHHTIYIFLTPPQPFRAELVWGEQLQTAQPVDYPTGVFPAQLVHKLRWFDPIEFIACSLEPTLLVQAAYELTEPHTVELQPHLTTSDSLIHQLGLALKTELETDAAGSCFYAETVANLLAVHLLRHYSIHHHALHCPPGGLPKHKLRQALSYINEQMSEDISLGAIAAELGMSQYYFCRLFKQSMGISPYQYLIQRRIEYAKQLLRQNHLSLTQIALEVGFANQSHLTHHFKRLTGSTPKRFATQWEQK